MLRNKICICDTKGPSKRIYSEDISGKQRKQEMSFKNTKKTDGVMLRYISSQRNINQCHQGRLAVAALVNGVLGINMQANMEEGDR